MSVKFYQATSTEDMVKKRQALEAAGFQQSGISANGTESYIMGMHYEMDKDGNITCVPRRVAVKTVPVGSALENYSLTKTPFSPSTPASSTGTVDSVVKAAKNIAGKVKDFVTGSTTPAQQKLDFSKFASKDTINFEAKTAEDMDEARQTLLKAGYVKVGTDKDGKEYYEQRTSSARNGSVTGSTTPAQQERDFSEFANSDTLTYNSKTAEDMDEARQTLLKAGYVKVGTDKDGKEYYEQRTSSAEGTYNPTESSSASQSVAKSNWSTPDTMTEAISTYSGSSSGGVSTPEVVTDPRQAGAIRFNEIG